MPQPKADFDAAFEERINAADVFAGADQDDDLSDMDLPDDQKVNDPVELDDTPAPMDEAVLGSAAREEQGHPDTPEAEAEEEAEAEAEEGSEEETEEETEAESEEETETEKPTEVPLSRLNKEVHRRKEAQKRIQELEQQLKEAAPGSIDDLNLDDDIKATLDGVLDGNIDVAATKLKEILQQVQTATRQETLREVDARAEIAAERRGVKSTVDDIIADLQSTYPAFEQGNDQFDSNLVQRTLALQSAYIDEGMDPATALETGAQDAMKLLRPELLAAKETPPPASKKAEVKEKRTEATVKRNVEAAKKQPKRLTKSDVDTEEPTVDITTLTDAEFSALSQQELARLRGDIL